MSWPWQSGQSGQPRPESVARTMTPIVTSSERGREGRARRASGSGSRGRHSIAPGRRTPASAASRTAVSRDGMVERPALPFGHATSPTDRRRAARSPCSSRPAAAPARRRAIARLAGGSAAAGGACADRARRRPRRPSGWGAPATSADRCSPYLVTQRRRLRPDPDPVLVPRRAEPRSSAPRTGRSRSRSTTWAATRRSRSPTADGDVHLDDRGRARHVRRRRRPARRPGTWGAEFTTEAPGSPTETDPRDLRRPATARRRSQVGEPAPSSKTPTLADVGGDVAKISTDTEPDPGLLRDLGRRRARGEEAVHRSSSRRRSSARAQQCGPTLDQFKPIAAANPDVTFINVEPYQLKVVDGQLQPVLDANDRPISRRPRRPTSGACLRSRGSSSSTANGIVQGSYELIASRRRARRAILAVIAGRLSRPTGGTSALSGASSSRIADRSSPSRPVPDADRLRRRLVLGEVAGRELGRVLERRRGRTSSVRRPSSGA